MAHSTDTLSYLHGVSDVPLTGLTVGQLLDQKASRFPGASVEYHGGTETQAMTTIAPARLREASALRPRY